MLGTTSALLTRAQGTHAVRDDLAATDLLRLAASIALTQGHHGHLLDVIRYGAVRVRPTAGPPVQ
jgi:hypothetical protein